MGNERNLNRFDNLDFDEMIRGHRMLASEAKDLEDAIADRYKSDNHGMIGKVFKIRSQHFARYSGRKIYVAGVIASVDRRTGDWFFEVHGPLKRPRRHTNRKGAFGGLYTSNHVRIRVDRLEISSERAPEADQV